MKRFIFGVVAMVAIGVGAPHAGEIFDAYGQRVDRSLDAVVSKARLMRMPNTTEPYDPALSVELLTGVVAENPDYYRAQYNLALSLLELSPEKPEAYLPAFDAAINLQEADPSVQDGSIYNTVGWLKLNMRDYASAEILLSEALSLEADNAVWTNSAATYNLGRLYFEQGDFVTSLEFLNVASTKYGNPAAIALKQIVVSSMNEVASPLPMAAGVN